MSFFTDISTAVKLTKEIKEARCLGYRVDTTWIKAAPPDSSNKASYWPWTREGCLFAGTVINEPIRAVFETFDEETRHALTFTPDKPEETAGWIERARFWQRALKPTLPLELYNVAMRDIWYDYSRAMQATRVARMGREAG